jgi:acyl carrier protein
MSGLLHESGGFIMGIQGFPRRATVTSDGVATEIRNLIANRLGVAAERVSDEAHFVEDLGADWLDRLELMIAIEDQFVGIEIADDVADQMVVVGDLIRFVEGGAARDMAAAVR